jgi:hypothetical protein
MSLNQGQFAIQTDFYICLTRSSSLSGHFVLNVPYKYFNHFRTELQVRKSWKSC